MKLRSDVGCYMKCTLNILESFLTLVVSGHIIVEGCGILFKRFVCTARTGLVLPGSVPI